MHKRYISHYISQFLIDLYADSILHSCKNESLTTRSQKSILYVLEKITTTSSVTSALLAVRRELSTPVLIQVYSLDNWDISRVDYAALLRAGTYWVDTPHGYEFWNYIYQMVISDSIEAHQTVRCFNDQDMLEFVLSS